MNKILAFLKSPGPGHLPKWAWGAIIVGGVGAGLLILHISQSSAANGGSSTDTISPDSPANGPGDPGGTGTGPPITPGGGGDGGGGGGDSGGGGFGDGFGGDGGGDNSGDGTNNSFGKQPLGVYGAPNPIVTYAGPPQLQGTQIVTYQPSTPAGQAITQTPYQAPNASTVTYSPIVQRSSPNTYSAPVVTYSPPAPAQAPTSSGTTQKGFAV